MPVLLLLTNQSYIAPQESLFVPYLSLLFLEHAQPCSLGFISVFIVPCSLGSKSLRRRIPVSFLPKETQQLEQPHTVLWSSFVE